MLKTINVRALILDGGGGENTQVADLENVVKMLQICTIGQASAQDFHIKKQASKGIVGGGAGIQKRSLKTFMLNPRFL